MANKVVVATYDGVGGPATAAEAADGFVAGPTDRGAYVIAHCGRHVSSRYAHFSSIRWGTPIKEVHGAVFVQVGRRWRPLNEFTQATREELLDEHQKLYGTWKIPNKWIYNDFGSVTCYMFKDTNRNRRLDAGERIHGEFFHTTPKNEAETVQGSTIKLGESHGCIHMMPSHIMEMKKKGYFRSGTVVFVYSYSARIPIFNKGIGKAPYELHFYPGAKKIVVKGIRC